MCEGKKKRKPEGEIPVWEISVDKICPHKPGSGAPWLGKGEAFRFRLETTQAQDRPRV